MNERIVKLPFFENLVNLAVLALLAVICIFPILHILSLSLSSATAAASGRVTLWPVEFTTESYRFVLENPAFLKSFGVSLLRVLVGVPVNMLLTILVAYLIFHLKFRLMVLGSFLAPLAAKEIR
ncbi:MAG: hypothetical protein HGA82_02460 [Anaerolineales bacterium]|nr:hypothetical protein [Anaerolineales bacterium]